MAFNAPGFVILRGTAADISSDLTALAATSVIQSFDITLLGPRYYVLSVAYDELAAPPGTPQNVSVVDGDFKSVDTILNALVAVAGTEIMLATDVCEDAQPEVPILGPGAGPVSFMVAAVVYL